MRVAPSASAADSFRLSSRAILAPLLLAPALILLPLLGSVGPAQAHSYLVTSTPEAGSTLSELPERFSITTNEAMLTTGGDNSGIDNSGFAMQVSDADGLYYGDGCVTVDDATMSTPSALGGPGTYLVQWQVVSADGHPISDEFTFEWQPSQSATSSAGAATAPNCGRAPADAGGAANLSDVLWVGGILVVVAAGALVTIAAFRRKASA
ncbi:MAG: copper resistance protein CopC [Salinibacterium sp.]|nr:copper resistance protein CopC [Salinibacterium sp.]